MLDYYVWDEETCPPWTVRDDDITANRPYSLYFLLLDFLKRS